MRLRERDLNGPLWSWILSIVGMSFVIVSQLLGNMRPISVAVIVGASLVATTSLVMLVLSVRHRRRQRRQSVETLSE